MCVSEGLLLEMVMVVYRKAIEADDGDKRRPILGRRLESSYISRWVNCCEAEACVYHHLISGMSEGKSTCDADLHQSDVRALHQ